ncbi:CRISPR-associated protein, Cse1 family (plasmid) [Campylobacter jejuni]|nr:CRISPR-associated protein, Cse1 family [Campylobacter jejuni]
MIIDTKKIKALLDDTSISAYKISKVSGVTAANIGKQRKLNDIDRMQLQTAVALYKAYQVLKGDKDNKDSFNLLTNPWIPVLTTEGTKEVSITGLFKNASEYRQLAGDSEPQNLAILRFLLAILQTVYQGRQPKTLINKGFNKALFDYLAANESKFEFQGNNSYLNIDIESFNSLVSEDDKIYPGKKTGTVAIRQIDRRISESKNSPALFSSRSEQYKDTATISELIRWLITYQGYAGVTDKVKLTQYKDKSISSGWLFKIDPVYIQGKNLFDTLVLNMVYDDKPQRPIWEWELTDYIDQLTTFPDNTAQLYTLPARLFHIEWNQGEPTIYAAGLPAPVFNEDDFLDPFATTYKNKQGVLKLNIRL